MGGQALIESLKIAVRKSSNLLQEGVSKPGEVVLIRQSPSTDREDFLTVSWDNGWQFSHDILLEDEQATVAKADETGLVDGQSVLPIIVAALDRWDEAAA